MKIMVISDIHGKVPALETALQIYKKNEFERLFILGDILYHGPRNPLPEGYHPAAIVDLLNPLKHEILATRGNCDSEVDQMLLDFPIMGDYSLFMQSSRRFVLTHGHLDTSRVPSLQPGDVRLSGHTHLPVLEMNDEVCFFNPGSISLPKGGNPPSYGVIDNETFSIKQLETGEMIMNLLLSKP